MYYPNSFSEEQGELFYKKGLKAYENKNYYEAIDCFDKAIETNYHKKEYSMYKGFCYFELGKYEKTINYFKKLAREQFDSVMFFYIGFSQYNLGKFDDSLTNIQFALKRHYKNVSPLIIEKAKECEKNILNNKIPPINYDLNTINNPLSINGKSDHKSYDKGVELYESGEFEEALKFFNELLKTDENNYKIWLFKGQTLLKLNEEKEALESFEKSLNIKENSEALMYTIFYKRFDI